jgi:uncharacterized membrane protein
MEYLIVKWLHILSSTFLFGTGIGSAFYMLFCSLGRDPRVIATVARYVVIADWIFTTPTIVLQPLTGWYLMNLIGTPIASRWIVWSIGLYLLAGACWLPVVWIQLKMRDMAQQAVQQSAPLPPRYWRMLRWWVSLGVVAFLALVAVFYLMVVKPQ